MMDQWVSKAMFDNILITGKVLQQKWTQFADLLGVPKEEHLTLSDGWLAWFKTWNNLKEYKCHSKAASVSPPI